MIDTGSLIQPLALNMVLAVADGRSSDAITAALAANMVREKKGKVFIVYVIRVERSLPLDAEVEPEFERAEDALARFETILRQKECRFESQVIQSREAGYAIVREAVRCNAEAIVAGMPYDTEYGTFTLGDDILYILSEAPCKVIFSREQVPPEE